MTRENKSFNLAYRFAKERNLQGNFFQAIYFKFHVEIVNE